MIPTPYFELISPLEAIIIILSVLVKCSHISDAL